MRFLQQILNGIALGGVYSLLAIGWTTVWGIVGMINWTHGDVFMIGGFFGLFLSGLCLPVWAVTIVAGLFSGAVAFLLDRTAYAPLRKRNVPKIAILITALGASTFLKNFLSLMLGPEPRMYKHGAETKVVTLLRSGGQQLTMNSLQLSILIIALFIMGGLQFFVTRTMTGKALLATSQDREAVSLMGVPVEKLIGLTFSISGFLGGVAGVMIGALYVVDPYMGAMAGIKGWAAAVLGGVGSISGAMAAGLLLGILENLVAAYISSGWRDAIAFLVMILTLTLKPSGLMGLKADEKV